MKDPALIAVTCIMLAVGVILVIGLAVLGNRGKLQRQRQRATEAAYERKRWEQYLSQCDQASDKATADEQQIARFSAFHDVYNGLVTLEGKAQVGISFESFQDDLGNITAKFNEFRHSIGPQFPSCLFHVANAVENYTKAHSVNASIVSTSGKRTNGGFIGGGFGVVGAIEGMAVATVLNMLTDNSSTINSQIHRLQAQRNRFLSVASLHVGHLRSIMLNIDKAEICSNCNRPIGALETPHLWKDHVVCAECRKKLDL